MASTSIQTVPSSFTSAFSKPRPEYDVFLNFRGDTRYKFTDHLYHALVDKEIITFRDDKELNRGEQISQELLDAIEKSRIAVIIFSENYASSTWCLEELAKIVECKDRGILTVLPIFYHVEPTSVRHQSKAFAKDFAEHEKCFQENPEKVQKWRVALTNVANISGDHLKDGVHEAKFIQSFVEWLYSILKEKRSNNIEDELVGISSRVEEMISCLDLESIDVRFIGICEKSGMGKTTLARAVFDKILNKFEACSFLENVREESKAHGLKTLQERLLCDIGKGGLRVKDVHKGMQVISDILHNKKVLIVVDDVSEKSQLETLVGKRDLFGKGSRIIVTTEDKDLLASYEIKINVYEACGLDKVEALQLFSLNAFHKPYCENDFLKYCNNFVEYAQRIPLVLKVLGSYLCTRTKNEWESAQNQLRAIPHEKTTKKLRIAFDGLGADEKKLFLDIACFFKGEEKIRVVDILESVYFPDINLKNLIDKSLITLVGGRKLWMHNLLQQMGWEIVSEESKEARERSRLWHCDDVLDVLKNNTGTKHIEGMLLRLPPDEEEELNAESFSKMNKLRLLKICKVRLSCLSYLSNELCLLEWHDYPLESLPNSFQPGELVELIMHRSCLQQLPSEFSKLGKLKLIDLSDSQNLTRTPDFTGFSNIERLNFQGCTRLHELHPSVGGLKRLILLNLKDCKCLKNLPFELNLESLKTLILSGCSRFKKFPRIGRNMRSLLELYLDGTAIEELPPTIRRLTGLTLLNLRDCKNLKSFPSDIYSLTSLEILSLSGCKCQPPKAGHLLGLSHIGSSIGATLTFPRPISFPFLSFLAWRYTYLRIPICAATALSIYCFRNAQHPEPEPINLLSNLFSKLSTLVSLDLSGCNLLALPDDLSCFSSIKSLNLSKNNFIHLPDCISQLSKLKILFLDHCSKLKSLPYVPLSTRLVSVQGCTALENYSSQVVVWTLGVAGFTIITCLGLAEDEDGTIAEVSLLDIHLLWQRYVKDQIHQMEGFCHVLPQIEIPEWFKHQRFGSFRPIPLPSNLFSNKNWKGIALCVIFVVPAHSNDVSPGEDSKYFHEFYCRWDINEDLIAFKVPKETYVGSFGLWLYISHARFRKHLDERNCITPFIGTNSPDIEINMCGARILYKQDMGEFLQNLGQNFFGSPNDLRGELKSHSQLSRLYQGDRTRNHLSDYIFPQIASPPRRWFDYQNGPAIKKRLPADLHEYSRWRPTPVTKLLPSNETIQGECTSRETIFSNQVIAAGTSKSSRQGSIYLGKISSSLECWFNHGPYLQDHYEGPGTFNQCLPQSEIPGWFKSENIARSSSVTIQLPLNLYDNLEWMGFAFCAVFSFQKHPTSVPMKGSKFSFIIVCHLKTNLGCMNPLYSISEEDVIISLHQRGFLWLSFIPCWFLSPEWSRCTSVEFSFVSDSSAVSALRCGVDLVYRQKLEFTRRMVKCITSYDGPFTSYERFPFYHPDQFSGSDGTSGISGRYSYDQLYKTAALAQEESFRRKEIEEALIKGKEEVEKVKNQRDQLMEEFRNSQEQIILLKSQQKERDEFKMKRDNALKEAEELRRNQAEASRHLPQFFSEYSLSEIEEATHGFDESLKIGQGGYGSIYEGRLHQTKVAIKRLESQGSQGPSEFQMEVGVLSHLRHPNLVRLIGSCPEVFALIYEYLPCGSLEDRINCKDNSPPLSWQTRICIATELCSVLVYLHCNIPHSIVHGDLKPSNVLLDSNFVCKLSDFGISRMLCHDKSSSNNTTLCHFTDPKGTIPYIDPEFLETGKITRKSDVYSFGIILIQLLTGRSAFKLANAVQNALDARNLKALLDPSAGDWPFELAQELARLALRCCDKNGKNRPDLGSDVMNVLEQMRASCGASSLYQQDPE